MTDFLKRINTSEYGRSIYWNTQIIELNESEEKLYKGAGKVLVYVKCNEIVKFVYPDSLLGAEETIEDHKKDCEVIDKLIDDAIENGNVYYGIMSGRVFCNPQLIIDKYLKNGTRLSQELMGMND